MECTIKLLGVSELTPEGTLQAFVSPTLVPLSNAVGNVNGATNVVQVMRMFVLWLHARLSVEENVSIMIATHIINELR